jgi:hypothetical protein
MSLILIAPGLADILPPASFETQGITKSTVASLVGHFSHNEELAWGLSSEGLGINHEIVDLIFTNEGILEVWGTVPEPPLEYSAATFEVQMHAVYSEDTVAPTGVMDYRKTSSIETKALPTSMYNIESERLFEYTGLNGNQVFSKEDLMLETVGTPGVNCSLTSSCIFPCTSCGCSGCYPGFCNYVQTGSTIDMNVVSASSSAQLRNVNDEARGGTEERWPPLPSVDNPARLRYSVRVDEVSAGQPSIGFVSAYFDSHIQEGGKVCPGILYPFQEVLVKEYRSVDGNVSRFSYDVEYDSGVKR